MAAKKKRKGRSTKAGPPNQAQPPAPGSLRGRAPGAHVRLPLDRWWVNLALHLSTVGLLSLAFPPLRWTPAAHVALVPMLLAVARSPSRKVLAATSAVAGVVLYAGQIYWMAMITPYAYVGVVLYCLLFWVAGAMLLRMTLRRTHLPLALLAPLVWVAMEWLRSWVLTGFPWLYLGHPQAASPVLLQVADLTGACGLSALSAATAGFVADLLTRPIFLRYGRRIRVAVSVKVSLAVLAAAWALVVGYGVYRLRPVEMTDGPLVVTVQTSVPQYIRRVLPESPAEGEPEREEEPEFLQLRQLTTEALAAHPEADLVVWPETLVPGYLNRWYLETRIKTLDEICRDDPVLAARLAADPKLKEEYSKGLAELREARDRARRYWAEIHHGRAAASGPRTDRWLDRPGRALLAGALALAEDGARYNSACLFTSGDAPHGAAARYDKVHLVPFGEYVPFRESARWLYDLLMKLTPYSQEYDLTPGREFTVMRLAGGARFAVPICFEDAFADVCREMVYRSGRKRADFLVNISNDGWFHGTVELDQHWDLSAFRAVENRVPVVRSVNTGISGFIDSCGRAVSRVADEAGHVRSVRGSAAWRVRLDGRESFYGRRGDVFSVVLSLGALAVIIIGVFNPRAARRKESGA